MLGLPKNAQGCPGVLYVIGSRIPESKEIKNKKIHGSTKQPFKAGDGVCKTVDPYL